jgi:outer membrane protein assembly factor BamB
LNAGTGKPEWNYATGGIVESSPAVANGVVYIGSEDSKLYAFASSAPVSSPATPASSPKVPEFPSIIIATIMLTIATAATLFYKKTNLRR